MNPKQHSTQEHRQERLYHLVGAFGLPFAVFAAEAVFAGHFVAIDAAAKGEDIAGFGSEDDVVDVDGAFEAAGLVGSFEVSGEFVAVLFDLDIFGGSFAVINILRVDGPFASDVVGRLVGGRRCARERWLTARKKKATERSRDFE
ncbi:MAG: hypothetical protein WAK48_19175 [Candidatus Acidiferrum sp.]